MTLSERLKEIEAREKAATEGPWENMNHASSHKPSSIFSPKIGEYVLAIHEPGDEQAYLSWAENDDEFIAHSRTDIPLLLSLVREAVAGLNRACECDIEYPSDDVLCRACATLERMERIADE